MHFGHPQVLWLLIAWILFAALGWRALVRRRRLAERIGRADLLERLYPPSVRRWRRRRTGLLLLAALLLVVAAARPQYGQIEETFRARGVNVLIALDCSASMSAQDVPPSRIERARQSLRILLRRLAGDRAGIIAFAGVAFLQCPMTLDREMAALVLDSLDTNSVGVAGTDLGAAIRAAADAFERGAPEGGRALVLLTDGEDNEGRGVEEARAAAKKGIRIYAIGIGSDRGAPIPQPDGGFKEDRSGAKVNTRLRMDTLREIAAATGGEAIEAGHAPERAAEAIAQLIARQEKADFESGKRVIYQDRFQWFLGPALALLLWALLSRPEPTRIGRAPAPEPAQKSAPARAAAG